MNLIGFPKTRMHEEKRIALFPSDIVAHVNHPEGLYFEIGYGLEHGVEDNDYRRAGAHVVSRNTATSMDIYCQPKFCDRDVPFLKQDQIVFGWLHLGKEDLAYEAMINNNNTGIAWEFMNRQNKHVFQRNNIITGEIGVMHAMPYAGKIPEECNVAIIGKGLVGTGARNMLKKLCAKRIKVYDSISFSGFKPLIDTYDVIVHAADTYKILLTEEDMENLKPGALFIHIGSDSIRGNFGVSSIYRPVSFINQGRNLIYCVNHVPTLAYQSVSKAISEDVVKYINILLNGRKSKVLEDAIVMDEGRPIHSRIS